MAQILQFLTLAMLAAVSIYTPYEFYLDHGEIPAFFGYLLLLFALYAFTGLMHFCKTARSLLGKNQWINVVFSVATSSDFIYKLHTLSARFTLIMGPSLYETDILLKEGYFPEEVVYGILAAGGVLCLFVLVRDYIPFRYTDVLILLNTGILGYIAYETQNQSMIMCDLLALIAYHFIRNDVIIADTDPKGMANFFYSGFIYTAAQSLQ